MQHQFYYDNPPACDPKALPKFQPSHEMELKRIRHERDEAKKRQHSQQGSQQPEPKRQRHNPGPQQAQYGGQNRGAGRGMPQAGPRAAYPVPAFDPNRPGMAPAAAAAAAAAAAGFQPGRHAGMPGAVPRGAIPGGPMQPPYTGPGRGMPVSSSGQGGSAVGQQGAAAYNAQGYNNSAAYGGRGAPVYPPGYNNYSNVPPGASVSSGYGAYGSAGGHNQMQGMPGRGVAARPNQPPFQPPTTIDRPAWNAQRR